MPNCSESRLCQSDSVRLSVTQSTNQSSQLIATHFPQNAVVVVGATSTRRGLACHLARAWQLPLGLAAVSVHLPPSLAPSPSRSLGFYGTLMTLLGLYESNAFISHNNTNGHTVHKLALPHPPTSHKYITRSGCRKNKHFSLESFHSQNLIKVTNSCGCGGGGGLKRLKSSTILKSFIHSTNS